MDAMHTGETSLDRGLPEQEGVRSVKYFLHQEMQEAEDC